MNGFVQLLHTADPNDGSSAVHYVDFIALFLFMLVLLVLLVAGIFVLMAMHHVRRHRDTHPVDKDPEADNNPFLRHSRPLFESPGRWLAIRSGNVRAVQEALNLHNPTPCSWTDGISHLHGHNLFISPPCNGWIVIIGSGLPDPGEDVDACFRMMVALSRELGEVQSFVANRAVNHHAWARAVDGQVLRAYAWAGETVWNQGAMTRAESALQLNCFDYGESPQEDWTALQDICRGNTEKVSILASRWSLDPAALDERAFSKGQGVAGDVVIWKIQ